MMNYLLADIEPSVLCDTCKETENKTLFESKLGKVTTNSKTAVERWCQINQKAILGYQDEWRAKSFGQPIFRIELEDII